MNNRDTAIRYSQRINELKMMTISLKNNAIQRLNELCKQYPDVPIANLDATPIKAKSLTKNYIEEMPVEGMVYYIDVIEKYLAEQQPVKQLEIEFPKN